MVPCAFNEENMMLNPPEDMTSEQCEPISAFKGKVGDVPVFVTCWKITEQELEAIKDSGRVWLFVWGDNHPPVTVSGLKPRFRHETPENG